jgi:hypothetical protein
MRIEIMAQEMEPRLYASLPKNMNGAGIAYGISRGNVLTDPSLPISGLKITAHNIAGIYVRTFGLLNKLARVQVTIPYLYMSGTAEIDGRDTSVGRGGTGDPRIRFSMSLLGAPAYDRKEFSKYSQETVVGVSIVTSVPLGRYLDDKRVNTGSNRWGFKPEIGISKRFKNVYAEAFAGVWLYTNNTNYLAGKTLEQKPVYSFQGHITYNFKNRMGLSASGTWFNGGQTVINGTNSGELLDNWRAGVSWSVPAGRGHSVKLQFHTGAFTSTGYDYDMVLLAYQYVFF